MRHRRVRQPHIHEVTRALPKGSSIPGTHLPSQLLGLPVPGMHKQEALWRKVRPLSWFSSACKSSRAQIQNLSSLGASCLWTALTDDTNCQEPECSYRDEGTAILISGHLSLTLSGAVVTTGRQLTQGVLCCLRGVDSGTL